MHRSERATGGSTAVEWRRRPADAVPSPVVRRLPYLECTLEHPDLAPTALGEDFFPDAVPYELDGNGRVFYWRPALGRETDIDEPWTLACATPETLAGITSLPAATPSLTARTDRGVVLTVDGTVGGDATTALVRTYSRPTVELVAVSRSAVDLRVEGRRERVAVGERRRISLRDRTVEVVEDTELADQEHVDGEPVATGSVGANSVDEGATCARTVTPELVVRYPGRRTLHHPAPGASGRLFPSFGITLPDLPQPVPVPTVAGELDDDGLAERLGVDLSARPYPERVLWQAFAYAAFDPHRETTPALAQLRTGHIVVEGDEDR